MPNMMMPIVAPLFVENARLHSLVTMVNALDVSDEADFELLNADGALLAKKHLVFAPRSQQVLKLSDVLFSAGLSDAIGSVTVTETSGNSMGIAAQLSFTSDTGEPAVAAEEEFAMVSSAQTSELRGLTPAGSSEPLIAIKNLSTLLRHVTVQSISERNGVQSQSLEILPGRLHLIRPFTGKAVPASKIDMDFNEAFGGSTAISITSDGMPEDIAAYAMARTNRVLVGSTFTDPATRPSADTVFTGVPVGKIDLLASSHFTPKVSVANFGSATATVTLQVAQTTGSNSQLNPVKTVTLPPQTTVEIPVPKVSPNGSMNTSFIVSSNSKPGDVLARVVSTSDAGLRLVDLEPKDRKQTNTGGGHPWQATDDITSTLLFFNHTEKPVYYNVNLNADGVKWHKSYLTPAHETISLSINELIQDQIEDDSREKVKLPREAKEGTVTWFTVNRGEGIGRLLQTNASGNLARNFSCGYWFNLCSASMSPNYAEFSWQSLGVLGPGSGQMCVAQNQQNCFGTSGGGTGQGYTYSWNSGNTGIAPISGSSSQTSAQFYGQQPGTAGGNLTIFQNLPYCSAFVSGTNKVVPPDHLKVVDDSTGPQGCPAGTSASIRTISYEVDTASKNAFNGPISIFEKFTSKNPSDGTSTCNGSKGMTSETCTATAAGSVGFIDGISPGCATSSAPTSCGYTWTSQSWHFCQGGVDILLASPGTIIAQRGSISVGGNTTRFATGTIMPK